MRLNSGLPKINYPGGSQHGRDIERGPSKPRKVKGAPLKPTKLKPKLQSPKRA